MAFKKLDNLVKFISATSSTNQFTATFSGIPGCVTPTQANAMDGKVYSYYAQSADGAQWEAGSGVFFRALNNLRRDTITANSDGTTVAVDFANLPIVDVLQPSRPFLEWNYVLGEFVVDLNGADIAGFTSAAYNKIIFPFTRVDPNFWYFGAPAGAYVPTAPGTYLITLNVGVPAAGTNGESPQAVLYKNGSLYQSGIYSPTGGFAESSLTALVPMNGTTDALEAYFWCPAGVTTLRGSQNQTNFQGLRIGAHPGSSSAG